MSHVSGPREDPYVKDCRELLRRCAFLILGVIPAIADEEPLIKEDAGLRGKCMWCCGGVPSSSWVSSQPSQMRNYSSRRMLDYEVSVCGAA